MLHGKSWKELIPTGLSLKIPTLELSQSLVRIKVFWEPVKSTDSQGPFSDNSDLMALGGTQKSAFLKKGLPSSPSDSHTGSLKSTF